MKKLYATLAVVSLLLIADIYTNLAHPRTVVLAQTTPGGIVWANPATSVSGCAWPTWVPSGTITGIAICPVNTGVASTSGISMAVNSGAFGPVFSVLGPSTSASGVTSFNGRTGAVVPVAKDYSFALLSGAATTAQLPAIPFTQLTGIATASQLPPMVSSFNTRTGAVTLTKADVDALGLTAAIPATAAATVPVN
jgi:hypothetical protein